MSARKGTGVPARGYSWSPFEPGHELSLRHGATSPRRVKPIAAVIAADLANAAPWTTSPAFGPTVAAWAWCEAQAQLLRVYIDDHGLLDDEGQPRPAVALLDRVEGRAGKLRAELGLTPMALGSLLRTAALTAATTGDVAGLAALQEHGRAVLDARAQLVAGDTDE